VSAAQKAERHEAERDAVRAVKLIKTNYASWCLIVLFLYYNIDRWTPLGKWNGEYHWPVHNDQFYLDLVVGLIVLGAFLGFWLHARVAMILGTVLLGLWTYLHLQTWWLPYFQGVTSPRSMAFHEQFLAHTQVLPRYGSHIPPDAEHTFIDVFVFPTFLLCLIATIQSFLGSRGNADHATTATR